MENKFYAKVSPSEYKAKFSMKPTFLHDFKQYVKEIILFLKMEIMMNL